MANFLTGSCIEVLPTDNTNSRFPDQIGCLGIVEHAPIHPSTWFTIKMTDGRSIKLQTTAMKHVAKNDSRHQIMQNTMPVQAHKSSHLICATPMDVQKENHRARSNSNVGIAHFTKGVSVIILRTDNVLHRVPHLVGVVGIIKEVPVHPITWFKIEFPSGQVATFRPSAFKLNDGKDEEVQRPSKKPTAFSANYNQLYSKKNLSSKIDKSNEHEYAAGMQVVIRSGELSGERGEVLKSSNGWIQVITPLGKVAKRAHELDFADCSQSSEDRDYYPPSHFNLKQDDHQRSNEIVSPSGQRALFLSHHKSGMGPRNLLNRLSQKSNTSFTPEGQKRNHVDMSISGSGMSPLYDLERQSADCPFPLIPLSIRQAKRQRLQSFVDSESEVIANRPDLSYWLQEINSALRGKEGNTNTSYSNAVTPTSSSSSSEYVISTPPPVATEAFEGERERSPCEERVSREQRERESRAVSTDRNDRRQIRKGIYHATHPAIHTSIVEVTPSDRAVALVSAVKNDTIDISSSSEDGESGASRDSDIENKDRSSSLSETDREEETYSPDQPSHANIDGFAERSIPSPFSLPPADTIDGPPFNPTNKSINRIHGNITARSADDENSDINNKAKTFTNVNKAAGFSSSIPNPVKLFLPRQYSSQSCPTFSPFQSSSFSPFTSATTDLKSPILNDHNEWANFFSQEKNKTYSVNNTPFVNSAFLPFTSLAKMS